MPRYVDQQPSHDTSQICLNGHLINSTVHEFPDFCQDHCSKCGARTVTICTACTTPLRGRLRDSSPFGEDAVPAFCHGCGKPFPWTLSRLQAAQSLADEIDALTDSEKITLKSTLDELIRDTPQSAVAVVRFKKLAAKGGVHVAAAFKDILVDVVSETVRKAIWGV